MRHFRKVWDTEKRDWILAHRELPPGESYLLFLEAFPDACDVTETAYRNERSRIGAAPRSPTAGKPRRPVPVGCERSKKGYVVVKVAEPNVWRFRHHLAWEESHPGQSVDSRRDSVLFLDMDTGNFAPDNLVKVSRRLMPRINSGKFGHMARGDVDGNLTIIKLAELEDAVLSLAERAGLTYQHCGYRVIRKKYLAKMKEWRDRRKELKQKGET